MKGEAVKYSCSLIVGSVTKVEKTVNVNFDFKEKCEYILPALADENSTEETNNDVFSVYFKWPESHQSATMKLYRCDEEVKTLDNDDYGTFYAYGFYNDDNKNYIGYKIDWKSILEDPDLGEADYYVVCEAVNVLGADDLDQQSFKWCLQQYTSSRADNTTRLEWTHDGIIGDWEDDTDIYSFDNWYGALRIPNSIIYNERVTNEIEERQFRNGQYQDIKREDQPEWDYLIELAPWFLHRYLSLDALKAETILITDYNSRNPTGNMIQRSVRLSSSYEPEWFNQGNKNASVTIQFQQKVNRHKKLFC